MKGSVITCLVIYCLLHSQCVWAQGGFTINESLMSSGVSNITLGGAAFLTAGNQDNDGVGWLRLTNANPNEVGYAIINESFNPDQGLVFDFEFAIWGGNGADGFSIFLFDANYRVDNDAQDSLHFTIGARGGSLGYANNTDVNGLAGGYLGIGLDAFGNYSNASESRNGGISTSLNPNRIGIRGAAHSDFGAPYRWLGGSETLSDVFGSNFTLDYKGASTSRPTANEHYRRVQVRLLPVEVNGQTNYQVSIHLKINENSPFVPVLPPFMIQDPPPPSLKVGFAGVTGGQTNIHEVRNLIVTTLGGVRVHKTVDKQRARLGEPLVYDIKLINESSFLAKNLLFTDLLPSGFEVSTITFDNGSDVNNQIISGWEAGQLQLDEVLLNLSAAPYGEVKFRVTGHIVDYPSPMTLSNTANLMLTTASNISDDDLSNNTSVVHTQVALADIVARDDRYDFDKFIQANAFANDSYNDMPIDLSHLTLAVQVEAAPIGGAMMVPYLDLTTGNVVVPNGTPRGNYRIVYRLIDNKLETNYSDAAIDLFIVPDVINSLADAYQVNWVDGGTTETVVANDRVNNKDFSFEWSNFQWLSDPPSGITLHTDGRISVAPMTPKGQYSLRYIIRDRVYSSNFQDNVAILNVMPNVLTAVNDYIVVRYNKSPLMHSNILENDLFNNKKLRANEVYIAVTSGQISGVEINEQGQLMLNEEAQYGLYDMTYTICDRLDGSDCSQARVRLKILPYISNIPNVITPNGDGVNDAFFIPTGVDAERMELRVFTRNGEIVYLNSDYRNDWSPSETEIKDGTYFYEVEIYLSPDLSEVFRGYLMIMRDLIPK